MKNGLLFNKANLSLNGVLAPDYGKLQNPVNDDQPCPRPLNFQENFSGNIVKSASEGLLGLTVTHPVKKKSKPEHENVKLYIKYMVSLRCKLIVKEELEVLGLKYVVLDLGMVEVLDGITPVQREKLKASLLRSGLELLDNSRSILIEKIKNVIVEMIHYCDELPKVNYSDYISEKLNYDYTYLANIFSEVRGITIQQFIILHKIERVKELLLYNESNLTEIAAKLHYSSVAHLSNQFKKVTGLTPSYYKQLKEKRSGNLENV